MGATVLEPSISMVPVNCALWPGAVSDGLWAALSSPSEPHAPAARTVANIAKSNRLGMLSNLGSLIVVIIVVFNLQNLTAPQPMGHEEPVSATPANVQAVLGHTETRRAAFGVSGKSTQETLGVLD